jgi:hypothetical protein
MVAAICTLLGFSQAAKRDSPQDALVDGNTIVRIFYQPRGSTYFHSALLFRVASKEDAKINTAPMFKDGRTPYISLQEMQGVIRTLSNSALVWKHSGHIETPPKVEQYTIRDEMEITIYSSKETYQALIVPQNICATLGPLESVFSTPRALWEIQRFSANYHCRVEHFNPDAYPQRDVVNQ